MNIALISTYLTECGIATYTQALAEQLAKLNHKITILSEYGTDTFQDQNKALNGVNYIPCWNRKSFTPNQILNSLPKNIDVIHVQHEFGLFPRTLELFKLIYALQEMKIKTVITLHTVLNKSKRIEFNVLLHRAMDKGLQVIVHTHQASAFIPNSKIIPHGITFHKAKKTITETKNILVPGFISSSKGHLEIIEAFSKIYDPVMRTPILHIVGKATDLSYLNKVESNCVTFGIENGVKIYPQFQKDPGKWYEEADLVILGNSDLKFESPYSASGQLHTSVGYHIPIIAKAVPIYENHDGVLYYRNINELAQLIHINQQTKEQCRSRYWSWSQYRSWSLVAQVHLLAYLDKHM